MKNKLDEMQEQKLLRIEHNGMWFAFWGLLIAIGVQIFLFGFENWKNVAGEWIVFMALAVYVVASCLKNGIWDRKLEPTPTTNLIASAAGGAVCGIFFFLFSYKNYHKLIGSVATGAFTFFMTFVISLAALTISAKVYHKRVDQLEEDFDEKE